MTLEFSKPDITFPQFPFINRWIEFKYLQVETPSDLVRFIHLGLNEIETSDNPVRIEAYKKIIYPLYSINTGRAYESKV